MSTSKNHSNEPTVGINFFESIPPVGLENYQIRWKNPEDLTYIPNKVEYKQTKRDDIQLNEPNNKAVVKGFGSTALFTAGLLAVSKQQGSQIRLDDGVSKHNVLHTAEDICRRNPTTVRKYYEERTKGEYVVDKTKTSKDENMCIPPDYMDEIFASDLAVILEEYTL